MGGGMPLCFYKQETKYGKNDRKADQFHQRHTDNIL